MFITRVILFFMSTRRENFGFTKVHYFIEFTKIDVIHWEIPGP